MLLVVVVVVGGSVVVVVLVVVGGSVVVVVPVVVGGSVVVVVPGRSPNGTVGPIGPARVCIWRSLSVLSSILALRSRAPLPKL